MCALEKFLRLKPLLWTICLFVLTLQPAHSFNTHLSSYGETCNETLQCDKRARLTCFEGNCHCIHREDIIFEESTGNCVTKAGHQCKFVLEDSNGSKITDFTHCVQNASCNSNGFCSCSEHFVETPNGTCSPPSLYLEQCDNDIGCEASAGLECQLNTCQCNNTATIFSSAENHCVGLAGQKCIKSKCIENGFCNRMGFCSCGFDFFANSAGKCSAMVDLGETCSGIEECHHGKGLICSQGVCSCDPEFTVYGTAQANDVGRSASNFNGYIGPNKTQCLGKVDSPCIDRLCVPNAYCSYHSRYSLSGDCHCKPGTVSDATSGSCGHGYGYYCSSTLDCVHDFVCNLTAKKCSCRYEDQFYHHESRRCQGKVGGPCSESMPCVSGAECIKFTNSSHGVCACKTGYNTNPTGFCELEYGQICNISTNSCDSLAGLDCIDEVCQCRKFGRYCSENRRCLGFVGTTCKSSDEIPQCVENAVCSRKFPGLQNTCNCKVGYTLTKNYTCEGKVENNPTENNIFKENEIISPEEI